MNDEDLQILMREFLPEMDELKRALRKANRALRALRGKVRVMDAERFNDPRPEEVDRFCRNYERADNIRQAIRLVLHNIRRLEPEPPTPSQGEEDD
jgi:hypothetical protein